MSFVRCCWIPTWNCCRPMRSGKKDERVIKLTARTLRYATRSRSDAAEHSMPRRGVSSNSSVTYVSVHLNDARTLRRIYSVYIFPIWKWKWARSNVRIARDGSTISVGVRIQFYARQKLINLIPAVRNAAGRSNIARHIRTVHKDAGTRHKEAIRASPIIDLTQHIQCVHCDLHFSDSVQMYVHLQAHEQDAHERRGGYNFYCDDCEQDHSSLDAYAGHMDAVHQVRDGQAIRPFKCRWCGERFRRTQGLYSHVRRAHQCVDGILRTSAMIDRAANPNRATDSCLCIECGRLMSSPTALVAHLKTHNDDRPHKCHVCDATFK